MSHDIWDWTRKYLKKNHQTAFQRGVRKAKQASFRSQSVHDVGDVVTVLVPKTSERASEEAGYHGQLQGEIKDTEVNEQSGFGGGGGGDMEGIIGGGFLYLLIAPFYAMFL